MQKREALNWTMGIVGLIASVVTIIVGLAGLFGWFQKSTVPSVQNAPAERPIVVQPQERPKESKKFGLGTITKAVGRAATLPKH